MQIGVPIVDWQKLRICALFVLLMETVLISVPVCAQAISVGDGPPQSPQEAMKELDRQIQRLYRRKTPVLNNETSAAEQKNPHSEDEKITVSKSSDISADKPHVASTQQQSIASISQSQVRPIEKTSYSRGRLRPFLITVGIACICGALILVLGGILLFDSRDR